MHTTSKYRLTFNFAQSCNTKCTICVAGADPAGPGCLSAPTEGELSPSVLPLFAFYAAFCLPGMIGFVCQNKVP